MPFACGLLTGVKQDFRPGCRAKMRVPLAGQALPCLKTPQQVPVPGRWRSSLSRTSDPLIPILVTARHDPIPALRVNRR